MLRIAYSRHALRPTRAATGLHYDNARNDDPALGTFISPDTLAPDKDRVINDNRSLNARGNPLKYTDHTLHRQKAGSMLPV